MASLRKKEGKYKNLVFHLGRGRRQDGSQIDIPTDIPIEPPDLSPDDPGYQDAKEELKKQALEHVKDIEARTRTSKGNGKTKMSEEEFEARAKFRAKKVLGQNTKASFAAFIIAWLWEHVIRNRIDYTKTLALCRLVRRLLGIGKEAGCDTIHDARQSHFDSLILQMQMESYAPSVVNNSVDYLNNLGRCIEKATGNNVTAGLAKEATDYDERLPFTYAEVLRIFATLPGVVANKVREWTIFLLVMLYTEMRPVNAKDIKREDIIFQGEIGLIRVESSKTAGFRKKEKWLPMHRCLQKHIKALLDDHDFKPGDYLLKHLHHMDEKSISNKFRQILNVADVDQVRNKGENRINEFSKKTLYSFKHTSCVWLDVAGVRDEDDEHDDSTPEAREHYRHSVVTDPHLLDLMQRKVNQMPAVDVPIFRDLLNL